MIHRWLVLLVLFLPLLGGHIVATGRAAQERKALPVDMQTPIALPGPLLRISALEYKGLVADFLFLKAHVFLGGTHERTTTPRVTDEEWQWLLSVLKTSIALDPQFLDPYYLAITNLVWDGGMIKEANELLDEGRKARPWDWLLPFYMGFNHFYFLKDDLTAAELLMEASRKPNAPQVITSLASRLAYRGAHTVNAIAFLEGILSQEKDEKRREEYRLRLDALKGIAVIEQAVEYFKGQFHRAPVSVVDLREVGILRAVPQDPYGGEFYLDHEGRVRTTSDLRKMRKKQLQKGGV